MHGRIFALTGLMLFISGAPEISARELAPPSIGTERVASDTDTNSNIVGKTAAHKIGREPRADRKKRRGYDSVRFAFPADLDYRHGILPNNYPREQLNADVTAMWQAWRTVYLLPDAFDPMLKRVAETLTYSNSEGTGYGMLISAYMANGANSGKEDFDALFRYYEKYEKVDAGVSYGLMAWRVDATTGAIASNYVAPDGDIDAAFALLVADKKWGSAGAINYKQEAVNITNSLMKWSVWNRTPEESQLIARSDFAPTLREGPATRTMSSYQIVSYFKQFRHATKDQRWDATLRAGYKMYDYYHEAHPEAGGLTPFTFLTAPGPSQYQRSAQGYNFGYDACRTPWRVGLDYLWHGNANSRRTHQYDSFVTPTLAHDMPNRATQWLQAISGGNPMNVRSSYELDGTPSATSFVGSQRNFVSPMAVAAMVDPANQEWLNTLYEWMRVQTPGVAYSTGGLTANPSYYEDTVLMLNMIVVTGNMPNLPEL